MGARDGIDALVARIGAAARAGVHWIQIREKDFSGRQWLELAKRAVREVRHAGLRTRIIVNDRLDVAIAAAADGVHLGEKSISVKDVREYRERMAKQREFLIGSSIHSAEGAIAAEKAGADYVFFGPVFATPSKAEFGEPHGVMELAAVCARVRIPVVAIGGITPENAGECAKAGAAGVAAIRAFQDVQEQELASVVARMRARR
jgi:thiamine-phosphate pyrophosphorylase